MVALPVVLPLTTPAALTLAIAALLLLHVPPLTASLKVVVVPVQTDVTPVMVPADGNGLIMTVVVADTLPQLPVTV